MTKDAGDGQAARILCVFCFESRLYDFAFAGALRLRYGVCRLK